MLFNSYEFIFFFFPLCVVGYFTCVRFFSLATALGFLVFASLFFYAYWEPTYLVLLVFSIGFNFLVGRSLARGGAQGKLTVLVLGVVVNLGVLAFFKYVNLFSDSVNTAFGSRWDIGTVLLPLAISFFTFQQVAFLVDVYRGKAGEYSFLHYSLFVCFFPQLIAGPIVRHGEIVPQFRNMGSTTHLWTDIAVGISIFAVGLFKKTVIADNLSGYVGPVFDLRKPPDVDFFRAWGSSLAYTLQLYFDFSGYIDMAVGAARVFGLRLPVNFFSPYKSTSIIEFWRRWHITLARFMRDYLYIPLGGSRKSGVRRTVNLIVVMLLGGLWHGAGWPFLVWGALHGMYLAVNHAWRRALARLGLNLCHYSLYRGACWVVTFVAIVFAWVYFRSPTLEHGNQIALAMLGMSGFEIPAGILARAGGLAAYLSAFGFVPVLGGGNLLVTNFMWVAFSLLAVLLLPNVPQVFGRYEPVLYERDEVFQEERNAGGISWDLRARWAFVVVVMGVAGILTLHHTTAFLYFQF